MAGRKTATRPPKIDPRPFDHALAALAAAQYGVFHLSQASALGRSGRTIRDREKAGRLFRLHRGVYSLVPPRLLTVHGRRMAAVLACGSGAGLSHLTAAVHIGLIGPHAPQRIDVTVPRRSGRGRPGIRIHRSATLTPGDVLGTYRIPTTTVARTLLDIAPTKYLDDAMDQAARLDLLDLVAVRDQAARGHARHEAAHMVRATDLWEHIFALTETQLEKLFLTAMRAQGLEDPELQAWLDLGDGGAPIRADFLWRTAQVIGEADGWIAHADSFESDRRRDQRAAAAGFQTLRVTRRQIVTEPARLGHTFNAVITRRS